jgi:hypothetical protein
LSEPSSSSGDVVVHYFGDDPYSQFTFFLSSGILTITSIVNIRSGRQSLTTFSTLKNRKKISTASVAIKSQRLLS